MRKNQKYLIIGIILVLALAIFGKNLFSLFQPIEPRLMQFFIDEPQRDHVMINDFFAYYGRTGTFWRNEPDSQGYTDPFSHSFFSNTVTINTGKNTFRFVAEKYKNSILAGTIQDPNDPSTHWYCHQKISVYKNDILIDVVKSWIDYPPEYRRISDRNWKFYEDATQSSWIELIMGVEDDRPQFFEDCHFWVNSYSIQLSPDTFNINISSPTQTYIEGQNITIDVKIENNLNMQVSGDLSTTFRLSTALGDIERTFTMIDITINPGENLFQFYLPATEVETTIRANANLQVKYPGENLQGLNFGIKSDALTSVCTGRQTNGACSNWAIYQHSGAPPSTANENVPIGEIISETQILSISPRPLYLPYSDGCPNGYVPNSDSSYCIRDDISELTCFVIGCPDIEGVQYACTSAGICAETVYIPLECRYDQETYLRLNETEKEGVNQNEVCPIGTTCDVSTGFCIKSEIYNDLLKCNQASDCLIPCQGKIATCNELKRCAYTGECVQQSFGCRDVGCSDGYTCNQQNNLCEKPSIFSNKILLTILGSAVIILSLWFLLKRFKRRK